MSDLTYIGRDGIPIAPLYTEPVEIDVPAREGPWQIRPIVKDAGQARAELANGADSLWYVGEGTLDGFDCRIVDGSTKVAVIDNLSELTLADTDVEELRVTVGRDVFKSIAKLRAARVLWMERTGKNPFLHAVGDWRTLTRYDAHTNIMRQTTQAFAAAVGGADAITVCGYDEAGAEPSELGRRIARNTQLILRDEAMLDAIADPAKGSYYLDWLTREMVTRVRNGTATADTDTEPIVGVTVFPQDDETPLPDAGLDTYAAPYEKQRE